MTVWTPLTYQDYAALPDDGKRYEVHDGELSLLPTPTPVHQIVAGELVMALYAHVKSRDLGRVLTAPLDVILSDRPDETTILQPDILFLDRQRLSLISERAIEGAPALVIEIHLRPTAATDRGRKRELYARYGVPHLWFVDPDIREVEAHSLGQARIVWPRGHLGRIPSTSRPLRVSVSYRLRSGPSSPSDRNGGISSERRLRDEMHTVRRRATGRPLRLSAPAER